MTITEFIEILEDELDSEGDIEIKFKTREESYDEIKECNLSRDVDEFDEVGLPYLSICLR